MSNPFKAFIPYLVDRVDMDAKYPDHEATDPSGGQWRTIGLTEALPGEGHVADLEGTGQMLMVQINERILPGKVRDEKLKAQVARIEAAEARKVSKKEYAELRDQVEFDLLPRAFIRRTNVPVLFFKPVGGPQHMLICTSSQKRADDIVAFLMVVFGDGLRPWKIQTELGLSGSLTTLARSGALVDEENDDDSFNFSVGTNAVLKGSGKKTIRIKDKSLEESDVHAMLKPPSEYSVTEVGVNYINEAADGETEMTFTVTENLTFKRCDVVAVNAAALKEDFYACVVLVTRQYRKMLADFFMAFGKMAERPKREQPDDDDEEL